MKKIFCENEFENDEFVQETFIELTNGKEEGEDDE